MVLSDESIVIALVPFVVKLLVVLELVALMLSTKLRNSDFKLIKSLSNLNFKIIRKKGINLFYKYKYKYNYISYKLKKYSLYQ